MKILKSSFGFASLIYHVLNSLSNARCMAILLFIFWGNTAIGFGRNNKSAIGTLIETQDRKHTYDWAYDLAMDKAGYIYLGTSNGLFYYNGKTFELVPGIDKSIEIVYLYPLPDGRLFASSFMGKHFILNNLKATPIVINHKKYKNFESTVHRFFYSYNKSVSYLYMRNFSGQRFYGELKSNDTKVTNLKESINLNQEQSKISSWYTPLFYSKNEANQLYKSIGLNNFSSLGLEEVGYISRILQIDSVHIAIGSKVFKKEGRTYSMLINVEQHGVNGAVEDIMNIGNNSKLVRIKGVDNGFYIYKEQTDELLEFVKDPSIGASCLDRFGNLWYTKAEGDVIRVEQDNLHHGIQNSCPDFISIKELLYSKVNNRFYILNINNQVYSTDFDLNKWTLESESSRFLFTDVKDKVIYRKDADVYLNKSMNESLLLKAFQDANAEVFLAAYKIFIKDKDNSIVSTIHLKTKSTDFLQLKNGLYEIATFKGLYQFELSKNKVYKQKTNTPLDNQKINKIIQLKNHVFYLTKNAIYKRSINSNLYEIISKAFPESPINILVYNNKLVGVSNSGYVIFDHNGKIAKRHQLLITNNSSDKLTGSLILKDTLILYNRHNIYKLHLTSVQKHQGNSFAKLKHFKFNRKYYTAESTLTAPWTSRNDIDITYNLYTNNTNYNSINYSIYHNNNLYTKGTFNEFYNIYQNNLPYGDFRITINDNNSIFHSLNFSLKPAWYQHNFFRILLILLFIAILVYTTILITNRYLKRLKTQEQKDFKLLHLERVSQINQLKPHFIFNMLTPFQYFILEGDKKRALGYLQKMSSLLRSNMKIAQNRHISITEEINFLTAYLELKKEEKSNTFDYEIKNHISEKESNQIMINTLLVQPIAENAITYGIKSIIDIKQLITITFSKIENSLEVQVTDNGDGFNLDEVLSKKPGHALSVISKMIKLIDNKKNSINGITTKKEKNCFIVTLTIPIKKN